MRRGPIPPGKAGLVVLAAAAIPVVIGAAKPLARAIGRGFTKLGNKLQEAAGEAKQPSSTQEPPVAVVTDEPPFEEPTVVTKEADNSRPGAKNRSKPRAEKVKKVPKEKTVNSDDEFETA